MDDGEDTLSDPRSLSPPERVQMLNAAVEEDDPLGVLLVIRCLLAGEVDMQRSFLFFDFPPCSGESSTDSFSHLEIADSSSLSPLESAVLHPTAHRRVRKLIVELLLESGAAPASALVLARASANQTM